MKCLSVAIALVASVSAVAAVSACGGGTAKVIARPAAVPTNLVPDALPTLPDFSLSEFAPARAR